MGDRDTCPECDVTIHPATTGDWVLHDGRGHYYMGKGCANCGTVGLRVYPDNGAEIKPEFRAQAKLDPEPPDTVPDGTPCYA